MREAAALALALALSWPHRGLAELSPRAPNPMKSIPGPDPLEYDGPPRHRHLGAPAHLFPSIGVDVCGSLIEPVKHLTLGL